MTDFLIFLYPVIKSLHLIAVISWMAGIFYLPRLFARHTEAIHLGESTNALFKDMERKLLKIIMNPAMIVTWICGLLMAATPGIIDWTAIWPWIKLLCIITMTWFHIWLGIRRKEFEIDQNSRSGKHFKLMNEVPTVLMIIIIIMVILRPF